MGMRLEIEMRLGIGMRLVLIPLVSGCESVWSSLLLVPSVVIGGADGCWSVKVLVWTVGSGRGRGGGRGLTVVLLDEACVFFWTARNCVTIFVRHSNGFKIELTVVVNNELLKSNECNAFDRSVMNPFLINMRTNCVGLTFEREEKVCICGSTICPNRPAKARIRWCFTSDSGKDNALEKDNRNSLTNEVIASTGKAALANDCRNTLASLATCVADVPCV